MKKFKLKFKKLNIIKKVSRRFKRGVRKIKDLFVRSIRKSINNVSFSSLTANLINYSNIGSKYDIRINEMEEFVLHLNPKYKMANKHNFSNTFLSKISDLQNLNNLYNMKKLTYKEYQENIDNKIKEIESMKREITNLRGNDNFETSLIRNFIYNLKQAIDYLYVDQMCETYANDPEMHIFFIYADNNVKRTVLNEYFEIFDYLRYNFDKETFITKFLAQY